MIKSEVVRGFEKTCEGMQVSGYVVEISNYTNRPAKKEEVIFR